jgi:hypothetical protein
MMALATNPVPPAAMAHGPIFLVAFSQRIAFRMGGLEVWAVDSNVL